MTRGDPRRKASSRRRSAPQGRDRRLPAVEGPLEPVGEAAPKAAGQVEESPGADARMDASAGDSEGQDEGMLEQVARLQAEFDNYRKRQAREFHRLCSQGKKDLVRELLAVLDNVTLARAHRDAGSAAEEIVPGLFQTAEQLDAILAREGLEAMSIPPLTPFDPNVHEAVVAEDRDDLEVDSVLEVLRNGYFFGSELLRPALVKVGRVVRPPARTE